MNNQEAKQQMIEEIRETPFDKDKCAEIVFAIVDLISNNNCNYIESMYILKVVDDSLCFHPDHGEENGTTQTNI